MKDQNPPMLTRRELLLRGVAGVAALGVGNSLLASCRDNKESLRIPKLSRDDEATAAQASSQFRTLLTEHYGMNISEEITLSTGLPVTVITDGNIFIDRVAFEEAFHLGLENIDDLPDGEYKDGMKKIAEGVREGEFSERKLFLAVSSDPQTCDSPLGLFDPIPDSESRIGYCNNTSRTLSVYNVDEVGQGIPPLVMTMYMNAGVDSEGTFRPNDSNVVFSAVESLSAQLSHEALHVYFSLLGMPRESAAEEDFILQSDRILNERFQQDPSLRPIPFTFKS